jgi:hypothetical protein
LYRNRLWGKGENLVEASGVRTPLSPEGSGAEGEGGRQARDPVGSAPHKRDRLRKEPSERLQRRRSAPLRCVWGAKRWV